MKKKIVFVGYYGCGNVGNDATLAGTLKLFSQDKWDVTVIASDVKLVQENFHVDVVRHTSNLGFSLHNILTGFEPKKTLQTLKTTDILCFSGGLSLRDTRFYNLPYNCALQWLAKLFGKPVIYFGIGSSVTTSFGKFLSKMFLKSVDYISVRDESSAELLREIGLDGKFSVSAEPAFALSKDDINQERISEILHQENIPESFVSTTIRWEFKWTNYRDKNLVNLEAEIKRFTEIVDYIISTYDKNILFIPADVPGDREIAQKIKAQAKYSERCYILQQDYLPLEIIGIIAKSQWLLATRLHSMIFATIANTPFFAIAHHQKIRDFVQFLPNEHWADIHELFLDTIEQKLDAFVQSKEDLRKILYESYTLLHKKIQEDERSVVAKFLDKPDDIELGRV